MSHQYDQFSLPSNNTRSFVISIVIAPLTEQDFTLHSPACEATAMFNLICAICCAVDRPSINASREGVPGDVGFCQL